MTHTVYHVDQKIKQFPDARRGPLPKMQERGRAQDGLAHTETVIDFEALRIEGLEDKIYEREAAAEAAQARAYQALWFRFV